MRSEAAFRSVEAGAPDQFLGGEEPFAGAEQVRADLDELTIATRRLAAVMPRNKETSVCRSESAPVSGSGTRRAPPVSRIVLARGPESLRRAAPKRRTS